MDDLNDKVTGGALTAPEWNQVPSEIQNVITALGITLSSGDLNQLGKAIAGYVANGDYYTDGGTADSYSLSVIGSKQAPPDYFDGMRVRFKPANTNTGASTVNVAGLGLKSIKTTEGNDPAAGEIPADVDILLQYSSASGWFEFSLSEITNAVPIGTQADHKNLVIKNNTTNPTFQVDIDATAVILENSAGIPIKLPSINLTADITTSGANGLDTGTEAISTWYHIWIIYNPGTTTVAALLSLSASAPTLPSGYEFSGYVGAIYNDSASDFIVMHQVDDEAAIDPILDANAISGAQSIALSVPTTAKAVALNFMLIDTTGASSTQATVASTALGIGQYSLRAQTSSATLGYEGYLRMLLVETQTIYSITTGSNDTLTIYTAGWRY